MKRFAKILSIALSAVLLLGALSVSAGAASYDELTPWFFYELEEGRTYTLQNTERLLAVNDWLITSTKYEGGFSIDLPGETAAQANASLAGHEVEGDTYQICGIPTDLPADIGVSDAPQPYALYDVDENKSYALNEPFLLKGSGQERDVEMVCLYIGTYCTVWGTTSDNEKIQLRSDQATLLGKYFDKKFPNIQAMFGGEYFDADGDGKVAIMCYDIDENYKPGEVYSGVFTGGQFAMIDMIGRDSNGDPAIGDVIFNEDDSIPYNSIDCIRIDTYPLMADPSGELSNVGAAYSTLIHEFQHMMNFSAALEHRSLGNTATLQYMSTFLNEAFSMAAEHLICGDKQTLHRILQFNDPDVLGTSLTYWDGRLDNYANSYLFGQYLRIRWKQSRNAKQADGSDFYKKMYSACGDPIYDDAGNPTQYYGNALAAAASLLDTDPTALVLDFWTAVCLNQTDGLFSFDSDSENEKWAKNIEMPVSELLADNRGIYNGGAKLYQLDPDKTYTVTATTDVRLIAMTRAHGDCGEDLTWSLSPDGVLYIKGDGSAITSAPWLGLPEGTQINSIHLPANLTSVPENAFAGLGTLDYVAFAGTVPGWQAINFGNGNSNDAVQNAACKYFDGDFVRMYWYDAKNDFASLRLITKNKAVGFAAAKFDANGRFLDYTYVASGSQDDSTGDNEYGGYIDFNAYGAAKFRVMAFTEDGPIDAARTFQLP